MQDGLQLNLLEKEVQLMIYSLDRPLVTSHTCASTLICIIVEAHSMETTKKIGYNS
jgi:hypothetical protein